MKPSTNSNPPLKYYAPQEPTTTRNPSPPEHESKHTTHERDGIPVVTDTSISLMATILIIYTTKMVTTKNMSIFDTFDPANRTTTKLVIFQKTHTPILDSFFMLHNNNNNSW
mmetsp:Transcript_1768/g.3097  ORF Transcript_1768/g.3097 Transcript_1768/m.3097 type:complete len:112 (-) Transcript_1768:14-349(-)